MSRDTNVAYSCRVLSKDRRIAINAVWDFCRAVDDEVDEDVDRPLEVRRAALQRWRDELAACFEGGLPQTPQGRALQRVVAQWPVPRLAFEQLIDGCAMDLVATRFATFADLRDYCYKVASTVGLVCIEVFGYENPSTRRYAVELGLALQLTNILRDVPSDLVRDRLYIPLDEMAAHGVGQADLRAGRLTRPIATLLEQQAQRARDQFARAEAALPPEDARRLVAARIMGAIYGDLLVRIAARRYDVFAGRVRVPRARKACLAAVTWMRTMALPQASRVVRITK
ncbi:MAG: phytoene/squalene synthase family protein [Luteitalea sp.]